MVTILGRGKVIDGMDEAQNEPLCSPADDDIDGHVVIIGSDLVGVTPQWTLARIP